MIKIIPTILLIAAGNCLFAQHIQYRDHSKPPVTKHVSAQKDSIVYHEWPDRCPAATGSIPVLTNYVPREMVLKLTEIYKGHLYSITSFKAADGKLQYKLKVCVKGELNFAYADETGNIISN